MSEAFLIRCKTEIIGGDYVKEPYLIGSAVPVI